MTTTEGAERLIKEAAQLIAPGDGEAVFYIRVGGEHSHMNVKAASGVNPADMIRAAINVLQAEWDDLDKCPVHSRTSSPEAVAWPDEAIDDAAARMFELQSDLRWADAGKTHDIDGHERREWRNYAKAAGRAFARYVTAADREVLAFAIIKGCAGIRAAQHAKEFQTANWSDALRSADAVKQIGR